MPGVGDTHPVARRVSVPDMVGRRVELGLLDASLSGDTRLVLIDGDAGVGKTRLVQEFVARVGSRATVLRGGCLQFEADLPFAPFAEALPDLFDGHPADAPAGDRAARRRRPRPTGQRRPRRTPTTSARCTAGGRPPNGPPGSPTTRSSNAPRRRRASPATTSARSS